MKTSSEKPIAGIGVLAVTAIAIGAAVLAAAGGWYVQYRQVASLRVRLEASDARVRQLTTELEAAKAALDSSGTETATLSDPTSPPATDASTEEPSGVTTQFCFVKDLTLAGDDHSLVLDYAQMLTGDAAAKAAKARGEESPPPNDYFIVNDNPKLRTFEAAPGAKVTLYYNGMADKRVLTIAQFAAVFAANKDGKADVPYHAVVSEDEVLSLEEQYLP